ncbi:EAL domain-containing protein [Sulfidibacter corallicola]|uniref:EAL domain-containing protein n=1 Tax=Sulfidibacter corallicola TaxID=2818388 RepID=A0A8A4TE27_SULCO|nr:bifunctional diguanylate cyclase/phosphodiesterase [Sulfidibacter corallicola]QTD47820.1 EAL domain-containing protein [Sulfidibacter corallicola]
MATKLAAIFSAAMLIIGFLLFSASLALSHRQSVLRLSNELKRIAMTASLNIDGDIHASLRGDAVAEDPRWRDMQRYLSRVREANDLEFDHLYTFHLAADSDPSRLEFAVMLHPEPFPGSIYQVPRKNLELIRGIQRTGKPGNTKIYTDAHGTWVSALAPIFDRQGRMVGLLEADLRVDTNNEAYMAAMTSTMLPIAVLFLLALPVGIGLIFFLSRSVAKPISQFAQLAEYTADSHWDHPIPEMKWPELQRLGGAFERMRLQIKNQVTHLRKFNQELEREVDARTHELEIAQENLKHQTARQLEYHKSHDDLTGLGNRLLFVDKLAVASAKAALDETTGAVVVLDIDRFQHFNDSLGSQNADRLLQEVGNRLRSSVKGTDTVSRIDGDEFALVLSNLSHENDAAKIAGRLAKVLSRPFLVEGMEVHVTASIGIAVFPVDAQSPDLISSYAETAMRRVKREGGNGYKFFTHTMNAESVKRLALETAMRKSLVERQFILYFQPQVSIATGRIVGAEALIRWYHPELGLISPGQFIPLAEETGLIVPMGKWILEEVIRQVLIWKKAGLPPLVVAVNLSARQFSQRDLVPSIRAQLAEVDLSPFRLELEITESIAMGNVESTIDTLSELREMGLLVAIDDFGTGYSSLSYLKRFQLDKLKIDKSFVDDLPGNQEDTAIAIAVINIGHALGLTVIAEGVENEEQLSFLRRNGCDEFQGYYFSRPLPAEEFTELMLGTRQEASKSA